MPAEPTVAPAPRSATVVPLVIMAAVVLGGTGLILSARTSYPERIVRHWGADGRPNGYTSLTALLITYPLLIVGLAAFVLVMGRMVHQERKMAAFVAGTAVFEGVLFYGMTWQQRGLTNTDQLHITPVMFGAAAAGLAVGGVIGWVFREHDLPRPAGTPLPAGARTLPIAPGTTLAWTGRTRLGKAAPWFAAFGLAPLVGMAIWFGVLGSLGPAAFVSVAVVLVAVLMTSLHSRVTIDQRGVQARSFGFLRWTNIPLDTIEGATVKKEVWPLGEFGGYGVRGGFDGSMGLVTARGPALVVERTQRKPYYLTVDDPDTAAATLNTLVARH